MNTLSPVRRGRSIARFIRPVWDRLRRLRLQDGLEAVEYALIAALISAVIVGAMATFGPQLTGIFNSIGGALTGAAQKVNTTNPNPPNPPDDPDD